MTCVRQRVRPKYITMSMRLASLSQLLSRISAEIGREWEGGDEHSCVMTDISTENPKNVPLIGIEYPFALVLTEGMFKVKDVGGGGSGISGGSSTVSLYAAATVAVADSALVTPRGIWPYTVTDAVATCRIQRLQNVKRSISRERKEG